MRDSNSVRICQWKPPLFERPAGVRSAPTVIPADVVEQLPPLFNACCGNSPRIPLKLVLPPASSAGQQPTGSKAPVSPKKTAVLKRVEIPLAARAAAHTLDPSQLLGELVELLGPAEFMKLAGQVVVQQTAAPIELAPSRKRSG